MKYLRCLVVAFLISPVVHAQQSPAGPQVQSGSVDTVLSDGKARNKLLSGSLGLSREVKATARDFATFRDPQWSLLTIGQIGAGTADMVTSLNNLHRCPSCAETGVSRFFVGTHPDPHKYIIAGVVEIGVEAVTAHYFRNHGPTRKWYWKALWALPQSFSLYEHARAANHNAGLNP